MRLKAMRFKALAFDSSGRSMNGESGGSNKRESAVFSRKYFA